MSMKNMTLAGIFELISTVIVQAQGTIHFNNRLCCTSHVWGGGTNQIIGNTAGDVPAGTTVYPGALIGSTGSPYTQSNTWAALLGAPAGSPNFIQGTPITTFRGGSAAGNIAAVTVTFSNIAPDADSAMFQMVVWDNRSGLYSNWAAASAAWEQGLIAAGMGNIFESGPIGGDVHVPPAFGPELSFNIYQRTPGSQGVVLSAGLVGGNFNLTYPSQLGTMYVLESCTNVAKTQIWWPVSTNLGDGSPQSVSRPAANPSEIFRLRTQ